MTGLTAIGALLLLVGVALLVKKRPERTIGGALLGVGLAVLIVGGIAGVPYAVEKEEGVVKPTEEVGYCPIESTALSIVLSNKYQPTEAVSGTAWVYLKGEEGWVDVGTVNTNSTLTVSPGDTYRICAGASGYDRYCKEMKIACKGTAVTSFVLTKQSNALTFKVFDEDGDLNTDPGFALGNGSVTTFDVKITAPNNEAFGSEKSPKNILFCLSYNRNELQSIDVSGMTKVDVPSAIDADVCYDTGKATLADLDKLETTIQVVAKDSANPSDDLNVTLASADLYKSTANEPTWGYEDDNGNAVGLRYEGTIYIS